MSKHRESVALTLEQLESIVASSVTDETVESLRAAGVREITIDLVGSASSSHTLLLQLGVQLRTALSAAAIENLRAVDLMITLRTRTRELRCASAGLAPSTRTMRVTTATLRTRIQTRWVHMWRDSQKELQSPHVEAR